MASVRKRGNSYQITVSNGRYQDGSQIIETATYTPEPGMTPRQIEKALEQFKVDFERSVKAGENVKGQQMKLSDLAALFLEDNKPSNPPADTDPLSITTWAEYRRALNKRILPRIGHIKIGEVIPKTMKDYAKVMRQDGARQDGKPGGLSEGTITKDLATVSTLLSYAVGEGLLQVNTLIYAGKQSKGRKKKVEYKVKCLTIEQTQALLWALDNPIRIKYGRRYRLTADGKSYPVKAYYQDWSLSLKWRAYFYLSLFMGDRRGENISLTWKDIDLSSGEVHIEKSTAYVDREIYHKDTKTHQSRTSVVPPVVIKVLKEWKSEQKRISIERGTYWIGYRGREFDKNYVFTQDTGKQMHPSSPYHEFKRIIRLYNENIAIDKAHEIPEDITPHDLRHTAASILIANNMDPRSVAGVLGHANPTTTLNIYSYFFQTKSQEAASITEGVLATQK